MGTRISELPEDLAANDLDVFPVVDESTDVTKKVKISTLTTAVLNAGSTNGQGVPAGGTDGQVLTKQSGTDYDTDWETVSGGGGGGDALVANPLSQFAATTSLELKGVISDETGSGALVFATSPTLVTPVLGTPASGVATNLTGTASGLTAGNVTTNANLTGPITSVGNATSIASQTGTGTKFVVDTSPTLVTPNIGTPSAGVATNLTGTASGLTAGSVTTNANLTGVITSVGNATSIASQTGTGTKFVVDTSPVLVTPNLGTPSAGTLTNCTFPTLNQSTTGSAATLTTTRTIWGQNFNGSANVTGTLALGSSSLTLTGSIAATGSRVTKGWFTDVESTNVPTVGGTALPTATSTTTLTNKRVTKRTGTATSSATPTINTDDVDFYSLTAQAADITSFTTNLSGTPTTGQTLWIAITGTGARAITWGASFEASTVALPTTTVSTNRLDVGFIWTGSLWRCVAAA